MDHIKVETQTIFPSTGAETGNWYAWVDSMPPPHGGLHVFGEVQVGNPGIDAVLRPSEPQGINPEILLLDFSLVQEPGIWPQIVTKTHALYYQEAVGNPYTNVSILSEGVSIATIAVEVVS